MAVGALAPKPPVDWPGKALNHGEIQERLEHWRRILVDLKRENTNIVMSRTEVLKTLDRWLDELLDLRGR